MTKCEVCKDAAFLNVEAVNFSGDEFYLNPHSFCFEAVYCPKCGRHMKGLDNEKVGGTDV